jgi:SAM-dependent methyltransferase
MPIFKKFKLKKEPEIDEKIVLQNAGFCVCCNSQVQFIAKEKWFRDHYRCSNCNCIPRERAVMYCIDKFFPQWREATIHESSPVMRGASLRIKNESKRYITSQFFPDKEPGTIFNNYRCENLEDLTFEDNSIDLHITQDVFEHIFNPEKAFKEIARTLRPGGMHIFTVPLVNKENPSVRTAKLNESGEIIHLVEKPEYHGNPISEQGSLVTTRWGYDICKTIFDVSGLFTEIIFIDSIDFGIRAEYNEVLISRKL